MAQSDHSNPGILGYIKQHRASALSFIYLYLTSLGLVYHLLMLDALGFNGLYFLSLSDLLVAFMQTWNFLGWLIVAVVGTSFGEIVNYLALRKNPSETDTNHTKVIGTSIVFIILASPLYPISQAPGYAIEEPLEFGTCIQLYPSNTAYLLYSTSEYYFLTEDGASFKALLRSEVKSMAPC